ncbi:hypothetical protein FE236_00550 [Mariprofundus erugo]|uniref:hypothetical protein n=1 Tax=Mariprofundus erugo TaxID=2528639 RepID=UPI0010FE959A|nr:hypothetical protein [Mariprofundus erugo]TLS78284.1 hypothetical protein FE236_00550 [Mariprofundus erugo]
MEDIDWNEVIAVMKKSQSIPRKYASFFQWHNREIMELGICKHLGDFLRNDGVDEVEAYKLGEDPPDCVITLNGIDIAVEITELVDKEAIKQQVKSGVAYPETLEWSSELLAERLNALLRKKDAPQNKDALREKYADYWLLVHTDEPELMAPEFDVLFDPSLLVSTDLIDQAYIVFSYDPTVQSYPVKRLF